MPQPLTSIIPPGIWWCRDVVHAAEKGFIGMPGDRAKPKQFWRDTGAINTGAWWDAPAPTRTYKMLARNTDGTPKLTPLFSPEFYATYVHLSVVNLYRQYAFLFPQGVPHLVPVTVPTEQAADLNFVGTDPAVDYPIEIGANHMLDARTGVVMVWDYQEFAAAHRVPAGTSNAQRRAAVARIVAGPGTDDAVIAQVREIVTGSGNANVQIT